MTALDRKTLFERAAKVRLVIFDVDGVLTDGRLHYTEDGREMKAFHSRDGLGMKQLLAHKVMVAVITARTSPIVTHRMAELGIDHVYQGQQDKLKTFESLIEANGIAAHDVCYIGDDVIDLPVMQRVGLAVTVADGHRLVVERAHWQTENPGGQGAARELCDLLLEARGELDGALERLLQAR